MGHGDFSPSTIEGFDGIFLWHIIISWDLNEAKKWDTTKIFQIHLSQELFPPAWPIAMVCNGAEKSLQFQPVKSCTLQ